MQDAIIAWKVRNWSKTALANGRFWPKAAAHGRPLLADSGLSTRNLKAACERTK